MRKTTNYLQVFMDAQKKRQDSMVAQAKKVIEAREKRVAQLSKNKGERKED